MNTRKLFMQLRSFGSAILALSATAALAQPDPTINQPPKIEIVMPADGQTFTLPPERGVVIGVMAQVGDLDGFVRRAEFFANDQSIGVVEPIAAGVGPINGFQVQWKVSTAGDYTLSAKAWDNGGATGTSNPVHIKVLAGPPPIPVVTIQTTDATAKEQNPLLDVIPDTARMVVRRTGSTDAPLEVRLAVTGSAQPGVDHDLVPGAIEIPAGAAEKEIVIAAIDDQLVEPEETVLVTVLPPVTATGAEPSYRCGAAFQAGALILDDEPRENAHPRVGILNPPDGAVFPAPETIRIVAAASDADGWVKSVEFFDGETSLGVVVRDPVVGPMPLDATHPEWGPIAPFVFAWQKPPVGGHVLTAVATDDAGASTTSLPVAIKVLEGSTLPVVTVVATDPEGAEVTAGDDGTVALNPVVFEIRRSGATEGALDVPFRLWGTALNGVDYAPVPLQATIPEGASSVQVVIDPVDDALVEGAETVILSLVQPSSLDVFPPDGSVGLLGRGQIARGVILDNDQPANQPPSVELVHPDDGEVFAAGADIRLVARATDRTGHVVSVEFFEGEHSLGKGETEAGAPSVYRRSWLDVPAGEYVLTAVATDDAGLQTVSGAVAIKVVVLQLPPVVTVEAVDAEGAEVPAGSDQPTNPAVFRIQRTGATTEALTVHYMLSGAAKNGVDYATLPLEVTVPAGEASAEVVVDPLDDELVEGPETVILGLVPGAVTPAAEPAAARTYAVGRPGVAHAVILDNESPANLPPRVAIVCPVAGRIYKEPATVEISAVARDTDGYVPQMEFFAGDEKIGEQIINFLVEPPPGETQKFSLTWSNVAAGTYVLRTRATDDQGAQSWSGPVGIVVVTEEPTLPPLVTIVANDPIGIEPDATHDADTASFLVHRTGDLTLPLTVEYVVAGSAANGTDYETLTGEVTIAEGQDTAPIVVKPLADDAVERAESVVIELQAPACIAIYPPPPGCYGLGLLRRAEARILDRTPSENHPPRVELVRPMSEEIFQAPAAVKMVAMADDADGRVVKVEFLVDGTKVGEQLAPEPSVTAADAERRAFTFVWEQVPAGRYVLSAVATDDQGATTTSREVPIVVRSGTLPPMVRIFATDPLARERAEGLPANTATFKVQRTGKLDADLTVFYSLHGTAENGKDYSNLPGSVVIPAGKRHADIVVTPINDTEVERAESVIVRLEHSPTMGPIPPYELGWPIKACGIILDNDEADPGVTPLPEDVFSVGVTGATGAPYQVEASDDLLTWVPVAEGVAAEGKVHFADPDMSARHHRFYRVRQVVMDALGLGE